MKLPKNVKEALHLNDINSNTFWRNALNKEMRKVKVAYEYVPECTPEEVRENKVDALRGFQEITCHVIFDVKMDFMRKARFVANGSKTQTPLSVCYPSVASRESVRLAFLVTAFDDLDIFACDIGNAYLNAPCKEQIWFKAGEECGSHLKGKVMKLVRGLYGLKSSGASWRQMFKEYIVTRMGFTPSSLDGDRYDRRCQCEHSKIYYELLLVYVNDVLAISTISHDPSAIMEVIGKGFEIKNNKWGRPTRYLGADMELFTKPDGMKAWSLHCKSYVLSAVEDLLAEDGRKLKGPKNRGTSADVLPANYKPDLNVTEECDANYVSRYQQLIGILRWAVELGHIGIQLEVASMPQYQTNPRNGHLESVYHIFHYLMRFPMKRLVMDTNRVPYDERDFNNLAMTED